MKKMLVVVSIFIFTFAIAIGVKADGMQLKSVDTIMAEIRLEQGVQNNKNIDVSKVTQVEMEELGDSVMEEFIGNSAQHDLIDNRLGGDGSANLTAVHTRIGYDYLMGYPISRMSFMGGGGMMGGNYYGPQAASQGDIGWGGIFVGLIVLILAIGGITYLIIAMTRPHGKIPSDPMFEIAKQRYANGEITKEEFEGMKERLKK